MRIRSFGVLLYRRPHVGLRVLRTLNEPNSAFRLLNLLLTALTVIHHSDLARLALLPTVRLWPAVLLIGGVQLCE